MALITICTSTALTNLSLFKSFAGDDLPGA
jgi:hypothetical protein